MSHTRADLEIAAFAIDEVVEGTLTGRDGATLRVSSPQLAVGAGEPALAEATVEVVRPGDRVRITNVLDAVVPDVRADDPAATFPGVLGGAWDDAAHPQIHRLRGAAVLPVCDWEAGGLVGPEEFPGSYVDMAGPGQDRSPWGSTVNIVLRCVPAPGASVADADAAIRRASLDLARALAATTLDADPDDVRRVGAPPDADEELPAVCAILQVASEGPLTDTFFDGHNLRDLMPRVVDPTWLFAGRLTNGAYDWPGVRNTTANYQDLALVRALERAHGETLRFAGLILAPGYLDTAEAKRRGAEASTTLAAELGAAGAICTTFSSGNSHTDTMLTVRALESREIATTALVCETNGGLTDHVSEADCLVSTGNEDELVPAWTPDRIVGGGDGEAGRAIAMVHYLGSCVETGDGPWTAVPA
ncbi:MAG TPA: glycine/sarcosine/betaine reductase component B subunit [Actinomycetota bacterium]|nr:glycine/sarcosine/betaine reductase component B subunit [Actinomycetota bacterium]